jgi:hypothetical protein
MFDLDDEFGGDDQDPKNFSQSNTIKNNLLNMIDDETEELQPTSQFDLGINAAQSNQISAFDLAEQ